MARYKLLIGATAAAFALSVMPVWAQGRPGEGAGGGGGGERPGGGGGSHAPANTGGGGGGSSSVSGGGSSGGGSGGGGGVSSFGGNVGAPSTRNPSSSAFRAPQRPQSSGGTSTRSPRGNGGSSERRPGAATPRSNGGNGEEGRGTSRVPSPNATADRDDRASAHPSNRAVPTYSRPRDGRQVTGSAVERSFPPVRGRDGSFGYYYPYGYGRYFFPGYGLGLGYYYDPLFYDPYYYGYGSGGYGSGSYGYSRGSYRHTGNLRLKIKPRDAQVLVDGYFVGTVNDFDGLFQRLGIEAGGHRIEIRADGFEPLQFEVLITPGETVTYKGELKRVQ